MYAALVTGKREIRQVAFPEPEASPGRAVVATFKAMAVHLC